MTKNLIILTLFNLFIFKNIISQEIEHRAPSLQIGLNSLSFSKGSLDIALITEIIADKQAEIKFKIIQNAFLRRLGDAGGTLYNYVDMIVKEIVQESNSEIRTKKIVETMVNLVFVYTFVNVYLQDTTSSTKCQLQKLADAYGLTGSLNFGEGLQAYTLRHKDDDAGGGRVNTKEQDSLELFITLLIDIASEVVRENEKLRELGLMRVSYSSTYHYLNRYNKLKNWKKIKSERKCVTDVIEGSVCCSNSRTVSDKSDSIKYKKAKAVYDSMKVKLGQYIPYIGAVNYSMNLLGFKSEDIQYDQNATCDISGFCDTVRNESNLVSDIIELIDSAIDELVSNRQKLVDKSTAKVEYLVKHEEKTTKSITTLYSSRIYLKKLILILKNTTLRKELTSDILYTLQQDIEPALVANIQHYPKLRSAQEKLDSVARSLYSKLIKEQTHLKLESDPDPFIRLLSALYEFDKATTFSEYTKLLVLLDDVFEKGKIKTTLTTINTFVKDYLVFTKDDRGNEKINFKVESFLVKLQNIKSDKITRLKLHFTVGTNNIHFINRRIPVGNDTINNLPNISEKIGLKIKLISKGDWWPRNPGETYGSLGISYVKVSSAKEPLISNLHLLFYASGILYNVANSSTNEEFDFPTIATGVGVTFYNALDFNIAFGVPIRGGFTDWGVYPFINVGFDIQFTEYLSALNKKRKTSRNIKKLSAAVNRQHLTN